mmetsp:Transcript_2061/g.5721  ORF Transcript_2061/g.5721 Transcript_2061/m.5721 type:complete len:300 (-) Transcript_2061:2161-3060(-)
MCVIGIRWDPQATTVASTNSRTASDAEAPQQHAQLVIIANRDEYYDRPSTKAHYWSDGGIFAGQDQLMGGTWLGCSASSSETQRHRFAVITNYYDPAKTQVAFAKSRGRIPVNFLESTLTPLQFAQQLQSDQDAYDGFNAILFDGQQLVYCSNRHPNFLKDLSNGGVFGLSNHLLDTPWAKVEQIKSFLREGQTSSEKLLKNMQSIHNPTTKDKERILKDNIFVRMPIQRYGTRTSTIVKYRPTAGFEFTEYNYVMPSSSIELESLVREVVSGSHNSKNREWCGEKPSDASQRILDRVE